VELETALVPGRSCFHFSIRLVTHHVVYEVNLYFRSEKLSFITCKEEKLDGPAASTLRRAIAEVEQRWSVMRRVIKNLL
jgi:hypothetical protein